MIYSFRNFCKVSSALRILLARLSLRRAGTNEASSSQSVLRASAVAQRFDEDHFVIVKSVGWIGKLERREKQCPVSPLTASERNWIFASISHSQSAG